MAPVTWRHEGRVAAPPDAVYAWMTDFQADDHARPAFRQGAGVPPDDLTPSNRTVISRTGDTTVLEDRWGRRKFRLAVTLDRPRREVKLAGQFGYGSVWRATPDGDGTLLACEGRMAPRGLTRLLLFFFAGGLLREMATDFQGHLEDARHTLEDRP